MVANVSISRLEIAFLKGEIEAGSNDRRKRALQALCRLFWQGQRVSHDQRDSIENTLLGVLSRTDADEKVRRWSLSALAQFGRPEVSWEPVIRSLEKYQDEPQVQSAAIAAAFKLKPRTAAKDLTALGLVSATFLQLSALQTASPRVFADRPLVIDVEKSDALTLKLSLILVGLNRAPANLFHPDFSNADLVRALGRHDDDLVSQYSVWAASENPCLSARHIGVDPRDVEHMKANVRAYVYRLFAAETKPSELQHLIIEAGGYDEATSARMSCAIGLHDTWYDGLEIIVHDWFWREDDREVRRYLLNHMARQSERCEVYLPVVKEAFDYAEGDRQLRDSILASAAKLPLYNQLRRIEENPPDLFGNNGGAVVVNIHNRGFMQGVNLTGSGDIDSSGSSNTAGNVDVGAGSEAIRGAKEELQAGGLIGPVKESALLALEEAEAHPSEASYRKAIDALERSEGVLSSVTSTVESGKRIAGYIAALLAALPM